MTVIFLHQLAISPQPRVSGEHISVTSGTQLTIKVEGVLMHGNKPYMFRTAAGIALTVTTQMTARANSSHDFKVCSLSTRVLVSFGKCLDLRTRRIRVGFIASSVLEYFHLDYSCTIYLWFFSSRIISNQYRMD